MHFWFEELISIKLSWWTENNHPVLHLRLEFPKIALGTYIQKRAHTFFTVSYFEFRGATRRQLSRLPFIYQRYEGVPMFARPRTISWAYQSIMHVNIYYLRIDDHETMITFHELWGKSKIQPAKKFVCWFELGVCVHPLSMQAGGSSRILVFVSGILYCQ